MYSLFSNSLALIVVSSFLQMTLGHSSWLHHLFFLFPVENFSLSCCRAWATRGWFFLSEASWDSPLWLHRVLIVHAVCICHIHSACNVDIMELNGCLKIEKIPARIVLGLVMLGIFLLLLLSEDFMACLVLHLCCSCVWDGVWRLCCRYSKIKH